MQEHYALFTTVTKQIHKNMQAIPKRLCCSYIWVRNFKFGNLHCILLMEILRTFVSKTQTQKIWLYFDFMSSNRNITCHYFHSRSFILHFIWACILTYLVIAKLSYMWMWGMVEFKIFQVVEEGLKMLICPKCCKKNIMWEPYNGDVVVRIGEVKINMQEIDLPKRPPTILYMQYKHLCLLIVLSILFPTTKGFLATCCRWRGYN